MRVRILGSAAGGGFPQWNCQCVNCRRLRAGTLRAAARTQASIAISADGARWCLINASPDLPRQLQSLPAPALDAPARTGAIGAVMLTDAELDHTAGLLSLRETGPLAIYSSAAVFTWLFIANSVFGALVQPAKIIWRPVADCSIEPALTIEPAPGRAAAPAPGTAGGAIRAADGTDLGLRYQAFGVPGKVPRYVQPAPPSAVGATVAYRLCDARGGRALLYLPCVRQIDDTVMAALAGADVVLFDGSFWSDDELARRGVGAATAQAMGHLPIDGPGGSLMALRDLGARRKIYTHINNTNPILDEDSTERRAITEAGWEVAHDGLEFDV
ncbi:MAG: pyrroloquinoline quinone biosynthesis protein PqqB [Candidatus Binataceae bacterium]|nr:pyrroloquinoline quinone biosynthesis protein PqqB [Candidatus Binataceae bacterium]